MATRMDTCNDCRFFHRRDGHPYGQCRRHSPTLIEGASRVESKWPPVGDDDWCGDFEARRSAA